MCRIGWICRWFNTETKAARMPGIVNFEVATPGSFHTSSILQLILLLILQIMLALSQKILNVQTHFPIFKRLYLWSDLIIISWTVDQNDWHVNFGLLSKYRMEGPVQCPTGPTAHQPPQTFSLYTTRCPPSLYTQVCLQYVHHTQGMYTLKCNLGTSLNTKEQRD